MIKLSDLKSNPNNPRTIKDDEFRKLCSNVKSLPKMMELRPIVVDDTNMVVGGNQRLKALKELGYKEIPDEWVKHASDFTEQELKQFIILDNSQFGEYDWDILMKDFDQDDLQEWGVDLTGHIEDITKPKEVELVPYKRTHILLSFPPEKMADLQPLIQQICGFSFVEYEQATN